MNYGQLVRAMETLIDIGNGELKDETPVRIFVDGVYKEIVAVYPETDGHLMVVFESGR